MITLGQYLIIMCHLIFLPMNVIVLWILFLILSVLLLIAFVQLLKAWFNYRAIKRNLKHPDLEQIDQTGFVIDRKKKEVLPANKIITPF